MVLVTQDESQSGGGAGGAFSRLCAEPTVPEARAWPGVAAGAGGGRWRGGGPRSSRAPSAEAEEAAAPTLGKFQEDTARPSRG